jgi:protein-S-isoprenylcysteine O-methyltransferase Ste14
VGKFPFGARGEWYVAAQFALMLAVAAGPVQVLGWPPRLAVGHRLDLFAGGMMVVGLLLVLAGAHRLGTNLTPLPWPTAGGVLVDRGIYARVRHPIYGGLMLMAAGWACRRGGGLALLYAVLLVALLAFKSRREETWMLARHAGYDAYRRRSRRFLPFLW